MNPNKVYKGVVGNSGMGAMTRDKDGDKVINVLDCQPNNPHKQGFIHDLANKAKEKVSQYVAEKKESAEQERQLKAQAKQVEEKTYFEERKKYLEKQAIERAKARAAPAQSSGGGMGFLSALSGVSSAPQNTQRRTVRYVKKGKGYVRKVSYAKAPMSRPAQPFTLNLVGGSSTKSPGMSLVGKPTKKDSVFNLRI